MQLTSHAALAAALALLICDSAHHTHACNRSLTDYSNTHINIVHAADMQQTGYTCPHLNHQTMACKGSLNHFWYRSHGNTHNQSTLHLLQLAQDIMDCSLPVGLFQLCDVTLQALNVCFQSLAAGLRLGGSFVCLLFPSAALTGTLCQCSHLCLLGSVTSGNDLVLSV